MNCPTCQSENIIKNGSIHNGKQKYACKDSYNFPGFDVLNQAKSIVCYLCSLQKTTFHHIG